MSTLAQTTEIQPSPDRRQRFLSNVLWSWAGVAFNLLIGFVLSPYVIRKLGADGYGAWALLFSLIGYYGLLDLGFKSALVRYSAYFKASGESEKINELINTIMFYYGLCSLVLFGISLVLARYASRIFHISPDFRHDFSILVVLTGINFIIGMNVFAGCLEGFQRFDISTRVYVATLAVRSVGALLLLWMGYKLLALGVNLLAAQILSVVLSWYGFRRIFPQMRLGMKYVHRSMLRQTAGYGAHTFLANVSSHSLSQGVSLLIAFFLPAAYVGYYALPSRLLQYTVDLVERVGFVSASNASELAAHGDKASISRLGMYTNRYSFAMFMPLTIFLLVYGREFLNVWVGPNFAAFSAPILPILLVGTAFAVAGQFNSSAILFGMARHREYSRGLAVETVANLIGMLIVIPRYGIFGAAILSTALMLLIRGLYTPWLVCRSLDFSLLRYLRSILLGPLLAALPVVALAVLHKRNAAMIHTWPGLIEVGAVIALLYFAIALFTVAEPTHRHLLLDRVRLGWKTAQRI